MHFFWVGVDDWCSTAAIELRWSQISNANLSRFAADSVLNKRQPSPYAPSIPT